MRFRQLFRRAGVHLLLLGVVAATLVTGAGNAQAATTGVTSSGGITLHLIPTSGHASPQDVLNCWIGGPIVTYTYATGEMDWQAGDQCNTTLRTQGSTKLFMWGTSSVRAYGSQYDGYYSSANSTGTAYAIFSGQWGVTINLLFFLPSGWTINPGYACSWFDSAHTQLQCSVTTGPVSTQ